VPLNYLPGPRTPKAVSAPENAAAGNLRILADNLGRYIYQLVDFSPLPLDVAKTANPTKAALFSALFRLLRVDIQNPATIGDPALPSGRNFDLDYINPKDEDNSWFGPLAALLVPAIAYQAYRAARTRDALKASLAVIGIFFLAAASIARGWDPATGRYFIIPVALCFPLFASALTTHTLWRSILTSFLVAVGMVVMVTMAVDNKDLNNLTRNGIFLVARRAPNWANEFNYRMVTENVPESASIGVVHGWDFRDYPFFGEHFTRRVALAVPENESSPPRVDATGFASDFQGSDFLIIEGAESHFIPDLASQAFDLLSVHNGNSLWVRKDLRASNECDDKKWPFTDFFRSVFQQVCARFPIVPPVAIYGYLGNLYLENGRFVPIIGVGPQAAFEFSLLVTRPTRARFMVEVSPRSAGIQTLQLGLFHGGSQPILFSAPFDRGRVLEYVARLQPAVYTLRLGLANGGTASIESIRVRGP
jgi:hypothetical protein